MSLTNFAHGLDLTVGGGLNAGGGPGAIAPPDLPVQPTSGRADAPFTIALSPEALPTVDAGVSVELPAQVSPVKPAAPITIALSPDVTATVGVAPTATVGAGAVVPVGLDLSVGGSGSGSGVAVQTGTGTGISLGGSVAAGGSTGVGAVAGGGAGAGGGATTGGGLTLDLGGSAGGGASVAGGGSDAAMTAVSAYTNIFRLGSSAEISTETRAQLDLLQAQVDTGRISTTDAVLQVADMARGYTSVAVTSYQFFSGTTPTAAGLSFLEHSDVNSTDLSDDYYAGFNVENRYINFASNLGLHSDYAPQFAQVYGAMSFQDAVITAYDRIVGGVEARAAGIDPQAAVADIVSRQSYFQAVAHERFGGDNQDLSTKLAAVAYIMEEAVKADVGLYGQAEQNFLYDLADGRAQFHVDLVGAYGHQAPTNLTT